MILKKDTIRFSIEIVKKENGYSFDAMGQTKIVKRTEKGFDSDWVMVRKNFVFQDLSEGLEKVTEIFTLVEQELEEESGKLDNLPLEK